MNQIPTKYYNLYETLGGVVTLTSGLINWLKWITHFFLNHLAKYGFGYYFEG